MTDDWHCGPLHVVALTANQEDGDHGRLLKYRNVNGNWKRWAMPMQMLAGDGVEVLGVLMAEGLAIDRKRKARLLDYINAQSPRDRLRAATMTGWHGGAFVLPDEVIGADDIWYQATERTAPYGTAGTLDGWRDAVAARAVGNPLLTLGLSAAFAGVLLERLNIDGAGLHLFGDSSTGKTSILAASISVWGGPSFRRTWRTTSNGLEGAAKMHTGTLLALDEVGEVNPRDLYEAAYALCNGHGKTRANVRGEARQVSRWRVFVLSTGEVTISSRMAAGGYEAKAGQSLRLLDVPVAGVCGAWDNLHGFPTGGGLSDAIRDGAARHYGHAGRAFVRALIGEVADDDDLSTRLQTIVGGFGAADGQESRAARIFGLCALAGELATQAGIVPWEIGQAAQAALDCFKRWREHRGTDGRNAEDAAILRAVADFIDKHGDSRFSSLDDHEAQAVRDRAGYWKDSGSGRLYLFTPSGLRDATRGYDFGRVLDALDKAGAISGRDAGRRSKKVRVAAKGSVSLYFIDPEKLGGER
ncbi:DNA primase, phage-associated [Castellaniella defragrans 65Phen]|uniref:DNA primase, phage-associated n=2 Tax=Castellaniella defragrans TaxID=75697 RepID=W8X3V1_CASD6|nr:DNA primase, phage-associated [Castellaniella defragrans 65Phen]